MIRLKTKEEIEILYEGGKKLSKIIKDLSDAVKPGVGSLYLENMAKDLIREAGGKPAFLGYAPSSQKENKKYPAALCLSVNEAIVHTPASFDFKIEKGDVVSLDLGFEFQGLITDMATTVIAGPKENGDKEALLYTTKKALEEGIRNCKIGAPISIIGKTIERISEDVGFKVIKELVGHGVGYSVHEEPIVPNYYDKNMDNIIMEEGLVIAIEPMISQSTHEIVLADDGWTYKTRDGSFSAHFEATIAITKNGPRILTPIV